MPSAWRLEDQDGEKPAPNADKLPLPLREHAGKLQPENRHRNHTFVPSPDRPWSQSDSVRLDLHTPHLHLGVFVLTSDS